MIPQQSANTCKFCFFLALVEVSFDSESMHSSPPKRLRGKSAILFASSSTKCPSSGLRENSRMENAAQTQQNVISTSCNNANNAVALSNKYMNKNHRLARLLFSPPPLNQKTHQSAKSPGKAATPLCWASSEAETSPIPTLVPDFLSLSSRGGSFTFGKLGEFGRVFFGLDLLIKDRALRNDPKGRLLTSPFFPLRSPQIGPDHGDSLVLVGCLCTCVALHIEARFWPGWGAKKERDGCGFAASDGSVFL